MPQAEAPTVDLSPYARAAVARGIRAPIGLGRFTRVFELDALAQLGYGLDPRAIPVEALRTQMLTPAVYMAYRIVTGIIRRPDLYSLRGGSPKVRALTVAWLWPLLPKLLGAAARGFAYGADGVVLDWERSTLSILVEAEGKKPRNATRENYTHYVKASETHPDNTETESNAAGELDALWVFGKRFGRGRVLLWSWDPEFGELVGLGALRRSWRSFCEYLIISALRDKYFERSVDSPRVSYSPAGNIKHKGEDVTIQEYVGQLLADLRGSGSADLPSARYPNGERMYEVETLEIPDRADAWDGALNRLEAEMCTAFLVSATLSGGLDDTGGAASRTLDGLLREHVEDITNYVCAGIQELVDNVHAVNGDDGPAPEFYATEVGKASARKTYQHVLGLVSQASRGEVAWRTDVPSLLDKLGVPLRDEPPEFPDGWGDGGGGGAAPPGRPRDPAGDREDRRDDARTDDGAEDTGAPRDDEGQPNAPGEGGAGAS